MRRLRRYCDTGSVVQGDDGRFSVLPLSARTPAALGPDGSPIPRLVDRAPDANLSDVCLTAGAGRSHFEHRAALVVNSTASAGELLDALADDRPAPGLVQGECGDPPKTAWLFPGQGSQYVGMARGLLDTEPVFRGVLTRCADAGAGILERPLLDVLFDVDDDETLRHTSYAQPALFAVEMGLARLWQSWGFEPDVVLGHSVGQYSAACVAGVFSLEDGAVLMAERGRLFGSLPAGGRMVAVFAAPDRVESCNDEFPRLSVAAYNGANAVLSGPVEDLERAVAELAAEDVRCDWLDTSHAFHSALLDPILGEFEAYLSRFAFSSPKRTLVCNRTGAAVGRNMKLDGQYWRRHARQPVEFAKSVRTLAELGCSGCWRSARNRCSPPPHCERGPTPRKDRRLSRPCAARAATIVRSPRPSLRPSSPATVLTSSTTSRAGAARSTCPLTRSSIVAYWCTKSQAHTTPTDAMRTETVRLLEDGRFEELAKLVGEPDGKADTTNTVAVLKTLAAQHNQQRITQTIADSRYEIRWEKSAQGIPNLDAGEGVSWLLVTDDADTIAPFVDALTAHGLPHRIVGLPASDADEQQLEATLRAAAEEKSPLRIVHLAALDPNGAMSTRSLERLRRRILGGTQRLIRAAVAAEIKGTDMVDHPWRAADYE